MSEMRKTLEQIVSAGHRVGVWRGVALGVPQARCLNQCISRVPISKQSFWTSLCLPFLGCKTGRSRAGWMRIGVQHRYCDYPVPGTSPFLSA